LPATILMLTLDHLVLVAIAVSLAALLGIPLGWAIASRPWLGRFALPLVNAGQTIPSLALLGFLIPLAGIGRAPAIVALVIYALLPIVRNTVTGLTGIDPLLRESASVLGLTSAQRSQHIELPLAAPSILAGLRIAAVTTTGTATIAAAIGAGGLGELIFRGVAMVDSRQILAGAIPSALLALLFDGGFHWIGRYFFPRSRPL
jgi:osmoprotectant transport system permease protein